ncbi:MAG: TolC family protein [Myxococcales bacterium]|nr:TolC family protein [Myxococcales bacterium]
MNGSGRVFRAVALAGCLFGARASGEPVTCKLLTRNNVATCATRASPDLVAARHGVSAADARIDAAAPWLPSRPNVAISAGRATRDATNAALAWRAELSQEIEIGGQRSARGRAARAEALAERGAADTANRDVVERALLLYFDALAAREEAALEGRAEAVAARVERATLALAERGGAAQVDADVAQAKTSQATRARLDAERRTEHTLAALASLVGLPRIEVRGSLTALPLPASLKLDPEALPEVASLRHEARAERARVEVYRRQRVPNLTLSLFVERDGYEQQVLGAGLSMPLPMPYPMVRTYGAEIRESEALALRAASRANARSRDATRRLSSATIEYRARERALLQFSAERLARTERSLSDLAAEIEGQRLPARDALLAQETLLDYLRSHIAARLAVCRASVLVRRATGKLDSGGLQ